MATGSHNATKKGIQLHLDDDTGTSSAVLKSKLVCSLKVAVEAVVPKFCTMSTGGSTHFHRMGRCDSIEDGLLGPSNVIRLVARAACLAGFTLIATLGCLRDPHVLRRPAILTNTTEEVCWSLRKRRRLEEDVARSRC